jgi:predicted DNA-binding protein (MmcQ/YjbR family)
MIATAEVRKLCRSFRGSAETFPSGAKRSVFKVAGKISPLASSPSTRSASSLKCEPQLAEQLVRDLRGRDSRLPPRRALARGRDVDSTVAARALR